MSDSGGRRHPAHWLAVDPDTGLTLLRVDAARLRPIRQAAGDPSLGADVFLIGNPFGLGHSVSRGHIAGLGRRLTIGSQILVGLIQIQAPLHPGDSGALLADLDGGWLGLVRGSLAAPGVGDNDVGFAIPTRDALWVADRLRATGKVDRAYLGLRFKTDAEEDRPLAQSPGPTNPADAVDPAAGPVGAEVVAVVAGSPADRSGLLPGDRVTQVDDRPVVVAHDLTDRLERTAAGVELALEFYRGAVRNRIKVQATSRPPEANEGSVRPPDGTATVPRVKTPVGTTRPDETATTILRSIRDQLDRLERRVDQLERENRERKSASNP